MDKHRAVQIVLTAIAVTLLWAFLIAGCRGAQDVIKSYRVIDGDTFWADVDIGWDVTIHTKIRVHGIDTPEKHEAGYAEAGQRLKDALDSASLVTVEATGRKTFDRREAVVFVDGEDILAHLQAPKAMALAPVPAETAWEIETQRRLNEAAQRAKNGWGRTEVVRVEPGTYEFVDLVIPPNVILQGGSGAGIEADLVYVGPGDQTTMTLRAGYSTGLRGVRLRCADLQAPRVVGVRVDGVVNGTIENVRVDLRGVDTVPLQVAGRESLTVRRAELRGSNPIEYSWGDNLSFTDCDLGASGNVKQFPSTVLRVTGMPHQITFAGSCTAQGGDHLVWGEVDSPTSGQGLNLYNVRWEGSTSLADPAKAAIHLKFTDRRLENLLIVGSRWTDRKRAFNTTGITQTTVSGSRLVGTQ